MPIRARMLAMPLLVAACGPSAATCPDADDLTDIEITFLRIHDDGRRELRGASLAGRDVPLLCGDTEISVQSVLGWCADGASLAMVESLDDEDWISVLSLDDPEIQRIAPGSTARWSPVGRRLAFIHRAQTILDAELSVWDGESVRSLATGDVRTIEWSPDAGQILTYVERETDGDLTPGTHLLGLDGSRTKIDTGWYAAWSPDGRWLAYTGPPPGPAPANWTLWVHELATGDVRPIGSPDGMIPDLHPRWSFDSSLVAASFAGYDCTEPSCYVVGTVGLQLSGGIVAASAREFAWSPKDLRIVVAEPVGGSYGPTRLQVHRGTDDEVVAPAPDDAPWSDRQPAWRP